MGTPVKISGLPTLSVMPTDAAFPFEYDGETYQGTVEQILAQITPGSGTVIQFSGNSAAFSQAIPANSILDSVRVKSDAGMTYNIGLSPGTDEVIPNQVVTANVADIIDRTFDFENATTIYFSGFSGNWNVKIVLK